jgi:hypothetical protein
MNTAEDRCYNMLGATSKLIVAAEWQAPKCGPRFKPKPCVLP